MAKILVVEDQEQISEMLVQRLERRGHTIVTAQDSETALSCASASEPDVILLESELRGEDEWKTARALKNKDHTRSIPIIALMANNSEETRTAAMQNGVHELHVKPIDFGRLLQQIDAALGESERGDQPAVAADED